MFTKMSVKQWYSGVLSSPLELIVGLSIFATVAAGGVVRHVASYSLAILFFASLVYIRSWPWSWRRLTADERLVLFGFGLYFFSSVLAYYNVNDDYEYIKRLGKYDPFLFIIPIYLLLFREKLSLFPYLLAGAIVSGPLYLGTALLSISEKPGSPAQGYYHHITFGDMAMLGALFMTTVLVMAKTNKAMKVVLAISIFCLLYASILSTARGAWLALPFGLFLLLFVAFRQGMLKLQAIVIGLVMLGTVVAVTPAKDLILSRVQKAAHEIELFQEEGEYRTSVGSRFAMWHVAIGVWAEHPVIGTGPGDFSLDFKAKQADGLYKKMQAYLHAHNIFFHALATIGTVGFIVLCLALFIVPFRLFYKTNREKLNVASVSGMVMLTTFAVFGLTESWTMRLPVVSVYLLYFVVLATTASRNEKN